MFQKKVVSENVTEKCTFFTLLMFVKLVLLITFFCVNFFTTFSTDSKSAWNYAFFDTFFDFFKEKIFLGHISNFFKLWSQTRKKRLKKLKNVFSKCILYFLKKSQIRCTLIHILYQLVWEGEALLRPHLPRPVLKEASGQIFKNDVKMFLHLVYLIICQKEITTKDDPWKPLLSLYYCSKTPVTEIVISAFCTVLSLY